MGYAGKYEEKLLVVKLRREGFSYKEIREKVKVSKSTLSLWCRDVTLTPKQTIRLAKKKLSGGEKGRIIGAKVQQQSRIDRTNKLLNEGKQRVGKLSKRERFIAGIALYAGDGLKGDKNVGFANSNQVIIKFMVDWFREFCKPDEKRLRGSIWLHENLDDNKAKQYWSKITRIPVSQFGKTYLAKNKIKSRKIRKILHQNGVMAIRIFDIDLQRKIKGWMSGVLGSDIV